jgi:hypothetical protein
MIIIIPLMIIVQIAATAKKRKPMDMVKKAD